MLPFQLLSGCDSKTKENLKKNETSYSEIVFISSVLVETKQSKW